MDSIWIITIIAIIFLQGSSIPQLIRNYRRKSTEDISIIFWIMVMIGYFLMLYISIIEKSKYLITIYSIGIVNILLLMWQIIYYRKRKSKGKN